MAITRPAYQRLLFLDKIDLIPIFISYLTVDDIAELIKDADLKKYKSAFLSEKKPELMALLANEQAYQRFSNTPYSSLTQQEDDAIKLARHISLYEPDFFRSSLLDGAGLYLNKDAMSFWYSLGDRSLALGKLGSLEKTLLIRFLNGDLENRILLKTPRGRKIALANLLISNAIRRNLSVQLAMMLEDYPELLKETWGHKYVVTPIYLAFHLKSYDLMEIMLRACVEHLIKFDSGINIFFDFRLWSFNLQNFANYHTHYRPIFNQMLDNVAPDDRGDVLELCLPNENLLSLVLSREDRISFITTATRHANFAIHKAVDINHVGPVATLLDAYPSYCAFRDFQDKLPLYLAIENGNQAIINLLLDYMSRDPRFSVNAIRNMDGLTQLDIALQENDYDVATQLQRYGADINAKNREGKSSLQIIIEQDNFKLAVKLLEFGADYQGYDVKFVQYVVVNQKWNMLLKLFAASQITSQGQDFLNQLSDLAKKNINSDFLKFLITHKIYFQDMLVLILEQAEIVYQRIAAPISGDAVNAVCLEIKESPQLKLNILAERFEMFAADLAAIIRFQTAGGLKKFCCCIKLTPQQRNFIEDAPEDSANLLKSLNERLIMNLNWIELLADLKCAKIPEKLVAPSRLVLSLFHYSALPESEEPIEITMSPKNN